MDWVAAHDVAMLLKDESFVKQLVEAILGDPQLREEVVEEVADVLGDLLDDDPRFRRRMAETVLSDPARKAKVIRQLADSLS